MCKPTSSSSSCIQHAQNISLTIVRQGLAKPCCAWGSEQRLSGHTGLRCDVKIKQRVTHPAIQSGTTYGWGAMITCAMMHYGTETTSAKATSKQKSFEKNKVHMDTHALQHDSPVQSSLRDRRMDTHVWQNDSPVQSSLRDGRMD